MVSFVLIVTFLAVVRGDDPHSSLLLPEKRGSETCDLVEESRFPDDFLFGAGTSAFQSEGAWNVSNKGESIWDKLTHETSSFVSDKSNADIAANSYYKYKEDIDLLKQIGANSYRMSISWPRILPTGFANKINEDGIRYYNDLFDEMLKNDITPFVTLFHWDLPASLEELGGWTNPLIVDWFVDYARVVFSAFGSKVKYWLTFNEPMFYCIYGYKQILAPVKNQSGIGDYLCGHHAMLAHAKTYHLYNDYFRQSQKGQISIVLSFLLTVPENPKDPEEVEAADFMFEFRNEWFLHPMFSKDGDYSKPMKHKIAAYSKIQGFPRSRLPEFSKEEIELVKNSADFLTVNYYRPASVVKLTDFDVKETVCYDADVGASHNLGAPDTYEENEFNNCSVKNCQPWGLSKILKRLTKKYDLPMMVIGENGYADEGQLDDLGRAEYFYYHLKEVLKLIKEGINIKGYFAWSLFDGFEWHRGYTFKYGVFSVDFADSERPRVPKLWSPKILREIYTSKAIPPTFSEFVNEHKHQNTV